MKKLILILHSAFWGEACGCDDDGSISLMNQSRPPVFRILPFFRGETEGRAVGCCDNRGLNPRGCNRKLCSVSWGRGVGGRAGFFNGSSIPKMSTPIMAAGGGGGGGYSFADNKFAKILNFFRIKDCYLTIVTL